MQSSICEMCLNSDALCSICKSKLERGETNQIEINISRFINELSRKVRSLENVKIEKAIESGTIVIVTAKGDAGKMVGKGGTIVKALAKKFGKPIKIIEKTEVMRDFMQSLISPAMITGVNIIYTPDGEIYKLRISSEHKKNMTIEKEDIMKIGSSVFDKKIEIIFENQF
ncbi:MAG: hypothetical protein KJ697_04860 [Nanoarchaeota archaeon]|nr:hypothetical protein [Nanoarchaeota archaeon]